MIGLFLMLSPTSSERGIAALCAIHGELAREICEAVSPSMLMDRDARLVIGSSARLIKMGAAVDVASLSQELATNETEKPGETVSGLLSDAIPAEHLAYHMGVVRSAYFAQMIVANAKKLAEQPDSDELISTIQRLAVAREGEKADSFFDFSKDLPGYIDTLERPRMTAAPLETGFARLDTILGCLKRRDLFTVSARPGGGKTAFVTGLAVNMAERGSRVLMYSTEMDRYQVVNRVMPSRAMVEAWKFRKQALTPEELRRVCDVAANMHGKLTVIIDDRARPTLLDIRRGIAKIKPDVVIVDYLQRCRKPKAENNTRSNDEFMVELKSIAKDANVLAVLLCQMNRSVDRTGRPMLSDLRDTGSIESESDQVMLLHTPDRDQSYVGNILMTGYVDKNRHGRLGKAFFAMDPDYASILEVNDGGAGADERRSTTVASGESLWPQRSRSGVSRPGSGQGANGQTIGDVQKNKPITGSKAEGGDMEEVPF